MQLTVVLKADGTGLTGVLRVTEAQMRSLGATMNTTGAQGNAAAGGVRRVGDAAVSAQAGVRGMTQGLGAMRAAMSGVVAVIAIAGIRALSGDLIKTADAMTSLNARLKLVTSSTEAYAQAQRDVRAISVTTRSDLESTATLYTRLSQNAAALNLKQSQLAQLTESVNAAVTLSGGSAASAAAGVQQLAQAFASGVLSGDEFRSVMENSPRLVKALTDSLGLSVGELRKLAEQQKLTADVVAEAILLQSATLRAELTQMPMTVGQAVGQVNNAWMLYVDAVNTATGETASLAQAIGGVAQMMLAEEEAARSGAGGLDLFATGLKMVVVFAVSTKNTIEALVNVFAAVLASAVAFQQGVYAVFSASISAAAGYRSALLRLDFKGAWQALANGQKETAAAVTTAMGRIRAAVSSAGDGIDDAIGDVTDTFERLNGAVVKSTETTTADAAATDDLAARKEALQGRMQELIGATTEATEAKRSNTRAVFEQIDAVEQYTDALRPAYQAARDLERNVGALDAELAANRDRLAGLSDAQISFNAAMREQNALVMQALALGPMTAEQQTAHERRLRDLAELMQQRNAIDAQDELRNAAQRAAEESTRAWEGFTNRLASAIVEGGGSVKRFWKQMLNDMKVALVQSGLLALVGALFGGGGSGGFSLAGLASSAVGIFAGGGSGGGGGNGYGSLLSAGGTGSRFLGSAGSYIAGSPALQQGIATVGPWAGAIGGAYMGAQNRNSTGARVAAGAAYGYAGYALGTVATGAVLGGASGAAVGAGAAGASAGAAGAAAAIPVVGWIVAALALIDAFSGGKLFGTKYNTRGSSLSIGVNANAATADLTLQQERQAALFGGIRRRDKDADPGNDARAAAADLLASQRATADFVADRLNGTVDELLSGAIRVVSRYSKKGKLESTKYFLDVLGRSFEEDTFELAAQRFDAEQTIAAIDAVLGNFVNDVVTGASGAIGGTGGGLVGARGRELGESIGELIAKSGAGIGQTGEASAIAERWRDDAEALYAGAQSLLAIATDMRNGFDLLGTGTLTPIIDLIDELAYGGESLLQTYQRIAQSTQLLEAALEMSGVRIDKTREDIVRLAVDIADAAGGLERASALWNNYFETFFTTEERLNRAQSQARAAANAALEGTGFTAADFAVDDGSGREAFRQAFEAILRAGDAVAIAQWLEAGAAISALLASEQQIAEFRAQQAAAVAEQAEALAEAERELIAARVEGITALETMMFEIRREMAGLSEFGQEWLAADDWRAEAIAAATAHAQAAGLAAARESDLATIELRAAQLRAQAIAQLTASLNAAAVELGYIDAPDTLDYLNTRIAELESASSSAASGIADAVQSIRGELDLLLGNLSPFNDRQKLEIARGGLQSGSVSQEQFLTIAQRLFGGTARNMQEFNFASQYPGAASAGGVGALGGITRPQSTDTRSVEELRGLRDDLLEQQREQRAGNFARRLAELSFATGDGFAELAAASGFSLDQLGADLNLSNDQLIAYLDTLKAQFGADIYMNSAQFLADRITSETSRIVDAITNPFNREGSLVTLPLNGVRPELGAAGVSVPDDLDFSPEVGNGKPIFGAAPIITNAGLSTADPTATEIATLRAAVEAQSAQLAALLERIAGSAERSADADETTAGATVATADSLDRIRRDQPLAARSDRGRGVGA